MNDIIKIEQKPVVEEKELYKYVAERWGDKPYSLHPFDFREIIRDGGADYVEWSYDEFLWCINYYGNEYKKDHTDEVTFLYLEISKILKDAIDCGILPNSFLIRINWRD